MIRKVLVIVAAVVMATTTTGMAQVFKDGPHVGFLHGGDTVDPGTAVGWQVAYEYTDLLSLEVGISRLFDKVDGTALGVGPFPTDGSMELTTWDLSFTLRAGMLLGERSYVYAGGGFGYYMFTERDMEDERRGLAATPVAGARGGTISDARVGLDDTIGYHIVVGAEFLIVPSWEFFVEYRLASLSTGSDITLVESTPNPFGGVTSYEYQRTGTFDYSYNMLRLGVNYRF